MTPQERIHFPPFTHGRIVCKTCSTIIATCRCRLACDILYTVPTCPGCLLPTTTELVLEK